MKSIKHEICDRFSKLFTIGDPNIEQDEIRVHRKSDMALSFTTHILIMHI